MTTDEIIQQFADSMRLSGKSPRTVAIYVQDAQRFLDMTRTTPLAITREHLFLWDGLHAQRNLKSTSRARYRVSMVLFLKFLHEQHQTPPLHLDIGQIKTALSDPKLPHPEDIQDILHGQDESIPAQARDAAIITLLAATGLRVEELVNLNCGDIGKRVIETTTGKKRLVWTCRIDAVKPKARRREINIGPADDKDHAVTRHFGLWYLRRVHAFDGYNGARTMPLFADEANDRQRLQPRGIRKLIRRAARRAGRKDLATWLHPHAFRHYFATWYRANGGDLIALQRHLGHASVRTTEKYVHLSETVTATELLKAHPLKNILAKPVAELTNDTLNRLVQNLIPTAV